MKRLLLLLFIVSVISVVGCGDTITDDKGNSAISGVIIDSITQQPIDSVAILLNDTIGTPNTYTDSLGVFKYIIWGGGVKKVFFKKDGYFTISQQIDFSKNPTDIRIELVKQ